jgi:hypothetical protein
MAREAHLEGRARRGHQSDGRASARHADWGRGHRQDAAGARTCTRTAAPLCRWCVGGAILASCRSQAGSAAIAAAVGLELDGEELFQEALRWHRIGKKVAIATVVDVVGSASRPIGGLLIVDEGGIFLGSVSAGCVEGEVITAALDVIETSEPCLLEFGASEGVWEAGLPCGKIKVYVEPLD